MKFNKKNSRQIILFIAAVCVFWFALKNRKRENAEEAVLDNKSTGNKDRCPCAGFQIQNGNPYSSTGLKFCFGRCHNINQFGLKATKSQGDSKKCDIYDPDPTTPENKACNEAKYEEDRKALKCVSGGDQSIAATWFKKTGEQYIETLPYSTAGAKCTQKKSQATPFNLLKDDTKSVANPFGAPAQLAANPFGAAAAKPAAVRPRPRR